MMNAIQNPFTEQLVYLTERHPLLFGQDHWLRKVIRFEEVLFVTLCAVVGIFFSMIVFWLSDAITFSCTIGFSIGGVISLLTKVSLDSVIDREWASLANNSTQPQRVGLAKGLRDFYQSNEVEETLQIMNGYSKSVDENDVRASLFQATIIETPKVHALNLLSEDLERHRVAFKYLLGSDNSCLSRQLSYLQTVVDDIKQKQDKEEESKRLNQQLEAL